MRILIFNVLSSGNKGDLAIIETEIQELRNIIPNAEFTVSAVFPKSLKNLFPHIRLIGSLIDMPTVNADSNAKDRKSLKYPIFICFYSIIMFFQCVLSLGAALFYKFFKKAIYRPDIIENFAQADLVIFNGGEAFKEGSAFLSEKAYAKQKAVWWVYLFQKLWLILLVKKIFKKPLIIFPNTVGPLRTAIGRFLTKLMVGFSDVFIVRDDISASNLKRIGVQNFLQTSDIVLLFQTTEASQYNVIKHTIGISPGLFDLGSTPELKDRYISSHAEAIDYLIQKEKYNIIFLPSNLRCDIKNNDLSISKMIINRMHQKANVQIITVQNAQQIQNILKQLDLLVSTRMHPTILASTKNIPFVSVIYDHKQLGFLSELGLDSCGLIVNDISSEKLISKIMYVLSNKNIIQEKMKHNVSIMQENTRRKIRGCITYLLTT